MSRRTRTDWRGLFLAGACAALAGAAAAGDVRHDLQLSTPLVPGKGLGGRLSAYSPGIGVLESARSGADSGLLRSSIGRAANFRLRRGGPARRPPVPLPPTATGPGTRRIYRPAPPPSTDLPRRRPTAPALAPAGGDDLPVPRTAVPSTPTALRVTYDYLAAIGVAAPQPLTDRGDEITTLVSGEPGLYRTYMTRGEDAFRSGRFAAAFDQFRIAHDISAPSVESLLGLCHARLAASGGSYAVAAMYLQRALRALPELALAPLRPEKLFGDAAAYRRARDALLAHLDRRAEDVDAQLLWAYFAWFEGRRDQARLALTRAAAAREKHLAASHISAPDAAPDAVLEAISTFRRGIDAAAEAVETPSAPQGAPAPSSPPPPDAPAPR